MKIEQANNSTPVSYFILFPLAVLVCTSIVIGAESTTLCDSPECTPSAPQISFISTVCDLGEIGSGSRHTCEFKFTNSGQAPLKIASIKHTCGCTVPDLSQKHYAAGETGTIKVKFTAGRTAGKTQKHIYVWSNDTANPRLRLTIKAQIVQMVALKCHYQTFLTSARFMV